MREPMLLDGDLTPDLVDALLGAGRIAVDTETAGLDWSTDGLHLCQLFTPETGALLLRNVVRHPRGLADVMGDPGVYKVFHYAPFDLRFLEAQWGIQVRSVACTKAASRLLDPALPKGEHSLQALLHRHLGVEVSKGSVRTSDWGAIRLSQEQIEYATSDVAHLLDLQTALAARLDELNLRETFTQVCHYMPVDAHLAITGVPNPLAY